MVRLTRLNRRRLEKGWSLDDLAKRTGLSRQQIGKIERGVSQPQPSTIMRLAQALDCRPVDLMEPE